MRRGKLAALAAAMGLAAAGSAHAAVIDFTSGSNNPPNFYLEDLYFFMTVDADFNGISSGWSPGSFAINGNCALCAPTYVRVMNTNGFLTQPNSFTATGPADATSIITVLARLQGGSFATETFTVVDDISQTFNFGFGPVAELYFSSDKGALLTGADLGELSGSVPEPATWAMMIAGFGMAGAALRRRRMLAA